MLYVTLLVRDDEGQVIDPAALGVDALVEMVRGRPRSQPGTPRPAPPAEDGEHDQTADPHDPHDPHDESPGPRDHRPAQLVAPYFEPYEVEPAELPSVVVLQSSAKLTSAIAALHAAALCAVADDSPSIPGLDPVADEVAAALVLSRRSATFQRNHAETVRAHPEVWAALVAGRVDSTRARILGRALFEVPEADCAGSPLATFAEDYRAVLERGLAYAEEHTSAQLDRFLRRLLAGLGLDVTGRRRRQAMAERGVWISHRGDGTADLAAVLASEDAERLYATVRTVALADRGRTPAETRAGCDPLPIWMADALVDLIVGPGHTCGDTDEASAESTAARPQPVARRLGSPDRAAMPTQIVVTIPIDSLAGLSDRPGLINGFGVIPADVARRLAAADARWRQVFVHRRSGAVLDVGTASYRPPAALARHIRLRDGICRFPGCRVPAPECDLDHLVPFPVGPTAATNLHALCRHHHRLKHEGGWQVQPGPGAALRWTSPLGTVSSTYPAATLPQPAAA